MENEELTDNDVMEMLTDEELKEAFEIYHQLILSERGGREDENQW